MPSLSLLTFILFLLLSLTAPSTSARLHAIELAVTDDFIASSSPTSSHPQQQQQLQQQQPEQQQPTQFSTQGLVGAEYESFVMGTVGDHPSDNSMHGGGYGSILTSSGPSPFDKYAQNELAYYGSIAGAAAMHNPISASFEQSLGLAGMDAIRVPAGAIRYGAASDVRGHGAATGGGIVGPGISGPGIGIGVAAGSPFVNPASLQPFINSDISNSKSPPSSYPPSSGKFHQATPYQTAFANQLGVGMPRNAYGGIGSGIGLGSTAQYATAVDFVGSAKTEGANKHSWGLDQVSATVISSRINGIPQAVAGGRIVGRFGNGDGLFGQGPQVVSAWTEAPAFVNLI